jgi:hypothetical protein
MPANSVSFEQQLRTSRRRIVRYWISRLFGSRLQKSQLLYYVDVNGRRYKRIVLRDSALARRIEGSLERFGETQLFPRLITTYEHEVWVDFIDGDPITGADESSVRKLAEFYAGVYAREPRLVALADTPFAMRLRSDLRFLAEVGVLDAHAGKGLLAAAEGLAPEQVWLGFDYTDPVRKNFVVAKESARICAVDVESLECDQLLGFGLGKAFARWLEPQRELFLECLADSDAPDLSQNLPYAELCFLAFWTKMGFLEQKWRYVDVSHFERFLSR